ncbi:MAG: aminoglycoside phosphotransferase family protein [Phycisphaerales bacterium]|nr:aminoglycoside phosphotransferase family protein [Phycisphaerales bacterium]
MTEPPAPSNAPPLPEGGVPMQRAAHDLGPQLEPLLLQAGDGKLTDIHWFRTQWQRGGAATAHASFDGGDGPREVVIKFPVGPREYRVLTELSAVDEAPTPVVVMHGTELGGFDFAWIVMEQLPGEPLKVDHGKKDFMRIAEAAAGFYDHAASHWPVDGKLRESDWAMLMERGREVLRDNPISHVQQWNEAVKHAQKVLPSLLTRWRARHVDTWCHGDLHLGNAMMRPNGSAWCNGQAHEDEAGRCILLDFAEVHAGHWIEDALYLERVHWANPELLKKVKPVQLIAKARKARGLEVEEDYAELAHIRRVLMAACAPAFLEREGHPAYMEAALQVLEKTLPLVGA